MPVITLDIAPLTPEKKEELIRTLTRTVSEITHIPETSFMVFIKECPPDAIGFGGVPLTKLIPK